MPSDAALLTTGNLAARDASGETPAVSHHVWRRTLKTIAVGVACYFTARLGLALQIEGSYAPAVWPASGLAVAAMLLMGTHVWPGIFAGGLFALLGTLPSTPAGIAAAAALATTATLAQVGTCAMVRWLCPTSDPFRRVGYSTCFLVATIASCLAAAVADAFVLRLAGIIPVDAVIRTWTTRAVGSSAGIALLAPVLFGWARPTSRTLTARRGFELATLLCVTLFCTELIFSGRIGTQTATVRPFLPLLLWAAFRFDPRETSSIAALVSMVGVTHVWKALTEHGLDDVLSSGMAGLFLNVPPENWLRVLQLFLGMAAGVSIVVAAAVAERNDSQRGLQDNERRLEERILERTGQLERANRELAAEVAERQRAERELRESLQEKETLLREIHHRVKNNLAVVCSLLYFETQQAADDQTRSALEQAEHRVRSMAMVHEKLYRSGNLAAIDAREYLEGLLDYLVKGYARPSERVRVRTAIDGAPLNAETAIPCGLIVTELVTNCLKHAFPDGRRGTIVVDLHRDVHGSHRLTVADDGVGMDPALDADNSGSLGWRLVRSLAGQIDGQFAVRRSEPGTEAVVRF